MATMRTKQRWGRGMIWGAIVAWALTAGTATYRGWDAGLGVFEAAAWGADGKQKKEDEKEKGPTVKVVDWRFTGLSEGVEDLRGVKAEDRLQLLADMRRALEAAERSDRLEPIGELFAKHPFGKVEAMLKEGTPTLDADEARALGDMRRNMIDRALGEAAKQLSPDGKLTIGVLDSGGKRTGIASDVDQTFFLVPAELAARMGPAVNELEAIKHFDAAFKRLFGIEPRRMGIESYSGKDFFPDWRQKHTVASFMEEADRVVGEKRKNSEAYRSEGQLKTQAEGRGYDALQQHHQRVRDLSAVMDRIQAIRGDARLTDAEKSAAIAGEMRAMLEKYAATHPAGTLAELREMFHRESPWTEVRWDEGAGRADVNRVSDPKDKVMSVEPERGVERFAFDGAWDNWQMFTHHEGLRTKYLLRGVGEGASLLRTPGKDRRVSPYEAEKMFAALGEAEIRRFVGEVYRHRLPEVQERYARALMTAAKDRLRHNKGLNPATGKVWEPKEIWQQYWPVLSEAEARLFDEGGKKSRDAVLMERARRAWEADAREIMLDNVVMTTMSAADVLGGRIGKEQVEEFAKIKAMFPDATPEKLTAAAEKQLYNAFHDLMSFEYARHLLSADGKFGKRPETPDLVQRLLDKVAQQDPRVAERVRRIAEDAAAKRIQDEADKLLLGGTLTEIYEHRQAIYEHLRRRLSERYNSGVEMYREAKKKLDAGEYTKEVVAERIMQSAAARWNDLRIRERLYGQAASIKAQVADTLGMRNVNVLVSEDGIHRVEFDVRRENFDGGKLATYLASTGNIDSAMQVWLAYTEGGKEAALKQAGFELVTNMPGVMHAISLKELLIDGKPEGASVLSSAMLMPAIGQAMILWSIGSTSVKLLGHYVLDPLKDDDADKMYQGFLDQRSGFVNVERSQRPSLLHFVPIRVVVVPVRDENGEEVKDKEGKVVMQALFAPYERGEIVSTGNAPAMAEALVFAEQYDAMRKDGALGGGEEWERERARVADEIANPVGHFEAKRLSMYYYYRAAFGDQLKRLLEPEGLKIDDEDAAPKLVSFFELRIKHWVDATGEFGEFGENTLIARRFEDPALRRKIAVRAAGDLIRSYHVVRGIEQNIDAEARRRREEAVRAEVSAGILALHDSYGRMTDSDARLMAAVSQVLNERRDSARAGAPRIHVRPTVIRVPGTPSTDGKDVDKIRLLVSVVADPVEYPPVRYDGESTEYGLQVTWERKNVGETAQDLTAMVTVLGARGPIAPPLRVPIGRIGESGPLSATTRRMGFSTVAEITSRALAELDKAGKGQLKLTVYFAAGPEGPWRDVNSTHIFTPGSPVVSGEQATAGVVSPQNRNARAARIAPDQVRIWSPTPSSSLALDRDYKPYYYKVGQTVIEDKDGKLIPSGETFTDVIEPGSDLEIDIQGGDAVKVTRSDYDRTAKLKARLSLRSQAYYISAAHFTLHADEPLHFFSGWNSADGPIRYAGENRVADILAPYPRQPVTIRITAEHEGRKAEKQVELIPDDAVRQRNARTAEQARQRMKQRIDELTAEIARHEQQVAKAKAERAAVKPVDSYHAAGEVTGKVSQLSYYERDLKLARDYQLPRVRAEAEAEIAALENDWKTLLRARVILAGIEERSRAIYREADQQMVEAWTQQMQHVGLSMYPDTGDKMFSRYKLPTPDEVKVRRAQLESDIKSARDRMEGNSGTLEESLRKKMKEAEDSYERADAESKLRGLADQQVQIAKLAAMVGDRGRFDAALGYIVHRPEYLDLLKALAGEVAMVTGDRAAAARMFLAGHQRQLENVAAAEERTRQNREMSEIGRNNLLASLKGQREVYEKQMKDLPAWWPRTAVDAANVQQLQNQYPRTQPSLDSILGPIGPASPAAAPTPTAPPAAAPTGSGATGAPMPSPSTGTPTTSRPAPPTRAPSTTPTTPTTTAPPAGRPSTPTPATPPTPTTAGAPRPSTPSTSSTPSTPSTSAPPTAPAPTVATAPPSMPPTTPAVTPPVTPAPPAAPQTPAAPPLINLNDPRLGYPQIGNLISSNRLGDALTASRQLAQAHPNHLPNRALSARLEMVGGNAASAHAAAEALYAAHPQDPDIVILRAQSAIWRGDHATAQRLLGDLDRRQPQLLDGVFQQGVQFYNMRVNDIAMLQFATVLPVARHYRARYWLALVCEQKQLPDRAIQEYQLFLQYEPTGQWANNARARIQALQAARAAPRQ